MQYTIIVTLYNKEDYIIRLLETLLEIGRKDVEVIIVNDGSTDDSIHLVNTFLNTNENSNIILINQENMGVSEARNRGIEKAQGDYIFFIDGDDETLLKKDSMVFSSEIYEDLVLFDFYIGKKHEASLRENIYTEYKKGEVSFVEVIEELLFSEKLNSVCNKRYKKEIILNNDIKFDRNTQMGEDLLFNVKYIMKVNSFNYIPEPYYLYNDKVEYSLTSWNNLDYYDDLDYVLSEIEIILHKSLKENTNLSPSIDVIKYLRDKRMFSELKNRIKMNKLKRLDVRRIKNYMSESQNSYFKLEKLILIFSPTWFLIFLSHIFGLIFQITETDSC